jgi:uncharacterized membrane protein
MVKTFQTLCWVVLGLLDGMALGAILALCFCWFLVGCDSPAEDANDYMRYGAILGGMLGVIAALILETRRVPKRRIVSYSVFLVLPSWFVVLLLLPFVYHIQGAAKNAHSMTHLKQLGRALQEYEEKHGAFPSATVPQKDLSPDQRLSWIVSILPYMNQQALAERVDATKGWEAEENREAVNTTLEVLWEPQTLPRVLARLEGRTHYVGISGVGADSAWLPVSHPRAGVFGYGRQTRLQEIRDGTSNTMMVTDTTNNLGPWAAGGTATLRAVDPQQRPYLGVGRPFGGRLGFPGGRGTQTQVLLADGSVRVIHENIKPEVFEALATIAGGEQIANDDF